MNISQKNGKDSPSFSLYVHLPFCKRKCSYCDFTSYPGREAEIPAYLSQVLDEWHAIQGELFQNREMTIATCYLGGGTPSLLTEKQITTLVRGLFPQGVAPTMEFTIEANPESLTPSKLSCYRDLGINRISIGIQSFSDERLRRLGRLHSSRLARECLDLIRRTGWENFSLDLMYGLPEQSPEDFFDDLAQALKFEPPHLSAYCLTLDPDVPLGKEIAKGICRLPSEPDALTMMEGLERRMAAAGYEHYEVSNFARPSYACRHNLTYWTLEPYIGLGAGAVSFIREETAPWGSHWENPGSLNAYGKCAKTRSWPFMKRTPLSRHEALTETILTGLRLKRGLPLDTLRKRFGEDTAICLLDRAHPLVAEGWIETEGETIRATKTGTPLLDTLILELIPDRQRW